jgi:methionyl-tRNA formyltransferase
MTVLRLLFITQEDPFYVRLFFEEFLAHYARRDEIAGVVIAPTMGKKRLGRLVRQMYDFYGPFDFLRMGLRYGYYKCMSRLGRRWRRGRFYSIRQVCEHYRVPVMETPDVNAAAFLARLRTLGLDLIVSVAAPQIFRDDLLAIPRYGCLNIHNAKLPKYRGMLPNFWQMFHGEKAAGTTIHRINARLDDGEILLQHETPIVPGESLESLICRTKRLGAHLMIEALQAIREGRIQPLPNNTDEATYFSFPTRAQVREFRARGYRLI